VISSAERFSKANSRKRAYQNLTQKSKPPQGRRLR
jgi:hypothetical protein